MFKAVKAREEWRAVQMTADESQQYQLAVRCGGAVRGTRLEPKDRIIKFQGIDGNEAEVKVGDWVLYCGMDNNLFMVLPDEAFHQMFEAR